MILHGLGVRAHRPSFGVEYAYRIRNDVEDRFELRDVAAEGLTKLFALTDVVAGEQQAAASGLLGELRERRFDQSGAGAVLKRDPGRTGGRPAQRRVDLIGQVRQ